MFSSRSLTALAAVLLITAGLSWPTAQGQEVTTADLEQAASDTSSWLMYGRDYQGHRFVELDQITPDNVDRLQPAWVFATGGEKPGSGGDAAGARGRDLPFGRRIARVRHRRADRREAVGLRAGDVGRGRAGLLLRVEQPRRGTVRRAGLCRDDGRAADRAAQGHRRRRVGDRGHRLAAGLQHHRRAAGGERDGPDRGGRRRVRHPRLREGLRRADRRAAVDDLHHSRSGGAGQRDVAGRYLEERRRPDLDDGRLRSRAEPRLLEHRQRGALELPTSARATTSGPPRPSPSTRTTATSAGDISTPPGTAGTTTRSARRCWPT